MRKLNKICLYILIMGSLTACFPQKGVLPAGYKFDKNSQEGLAVMSVSCNVSQGLMEIGLSSADSAGDFYQVPINCNDPMDDLSSPEIKILKLSPGKYYFTNVSETLSGGRELSSTEFRKRYFDVKPGVITYLGWLNLEAGFGGHSTLFYKNAEKRDISWARRIAPNVSPDARVDVQDKFFHK